MAVTEKIKEVKVVLNLTKGTQTIGNCKADAEAEKLHQLGQAIGGLHEETVEKIYKVVESELVLN